MATLTTKMLPLATQVGIEGQKSNDADKAALMKMAGDYMKMQQEGKQHAATLGETSQHNRATEENQKETNEIMKFYRNLEGAKFKNEASNQKLKILLQGNGPEGKAQGQEAQKISNLADVARQSLNSTEDIAKEHPYLSAIENFTPGAVSSALGGKMGEIYKNRASTKEAMQNLYTGAAASGEQVPAFKAFSGPGALDALFGNVENSSKGVRNQINTMQQGADKKQRSLSPELLKTAGMSNDPIAQFLMKQQNTSIQDANQKRLIGMSPEDRASFMQLQASGVSNPDQEQAYHRLEGRYGPKVAGNIPINQVGTGMAQAPAAPPAGPTSVPTSGLFGNGAQAGPADPELEELNALRKKYRGQ